MCPGLGTCCSPGSGKRLSLSPCPALKATCTSRSSQAPAALWRFPGSRSPLVSQRTDTPLGALPQVAFWTFGDLLISLLDCNFFEVGLHFIFKKKKISPSYPVQLFTQTCANSQIEGEERKQNSQCLGSGGLPGRRGLPGWRAGSCGQGTVQRASGLGVTDLGPLLFTHSLYELGQMINSLQA